MLLLLSILGRSPRGESLVSLVLAGAKEEQAWVMKVIWAKEICRYVAFVIG
jgi:hypothetical protein